jgi:diguanylate cyclase (GGDEF)-like protein/PAS domain S-box-containing protein
VLPEAADSPVPLEPHEHEEQFRTLVENISGVATYLDRVVVDDPARSAPVYMSPQVEKMFGYPREEWLQDRELWARLLHPADAQRAIDAVEQAWARRGTLSVEYRIVAKDTSIVWVSEHSSIVRDVASGAPYWQGVMVDITERKHAEEAQQASEVKFRTIFDAASIGVFTLDMRGLIQRANPTLEFVGSYESGELDDEPLLKFVDPDDERTLNVFGELMNGDRDRFDLEHRFRRKDGSMFWCRTVMVLVRDALGSPTYAMGMLEDIDHRKGVEDELVRRALLDPLTGLPNRQLLLDRLTIATAQLERRMGEGLAVIFMDLDGFKAVNDHLGHQLGDELLISVARRLSKVVRSADTVARFGGDEFVVLVGDVSAMDDATQQAERLAEALTGPFDLGGVETRVTASFGVTVSLDPEVEPRELIQRADAAMYRAKRAGRNRIETSAPAP